MRPPLPWENNDFLEMTQMTVFLKKKNRKRVPLITEGEKMQKES